MRRSAGRRCSGFGDYEEHGAGWGEVVIFPAGGVGAGVPQPGQAGGAGGGCWGAACCLQRNWGGLEVVLVDEQ